MALTKCSECSQEVSDRATSCPHCGSPINKEISVSAMPTMKVEVELTNKLWKKVILFSWLTLFIGAALASVTEGGGASIFLIIISVIMWVTGKIGAWYSNR